MAELTDYETLVLLCRRASSLPPLPIAVMRLIKEIDEGDASAAQLERIITSDPALAISFMRWATLEDTDGNLDAGSCIRSAVLLLGQRAVRNMAVSILIQNGLKQPVADCDFNARAFARHSVFVGILAHYIAARAGSETSSADDITDVFAASILHELPCYLLARLAPDAFSRIERYARKRELGLHHSFEMIYKHPIGELGAVACETWGLPAVFAKYMRHMADPWMADELERGVCAIRYADVLARTAGWGVEDWPVHEELPIEVLEEVELPEAERDIVLGRVATMAEAQSPAESAATSTRAVSL